MHDEMPPGARCPPVTLAALDYNTSIGAANSTLLTDSGPIIYISLLKGRGGVFLDRLLLGLISYNLLISAVGLSLLLVCRSISTY